MSFLNFYVGRLAYSDSMPVQNPQQRNFDFVSQAQGIEVSSPCSIIKTVPPGETLELTSTERTIASLLSASEFEVTVEPGTGIVRIRWTGTGPSPEFRAPRAVVYGTTPETTQYVASRLSQTAVKITLSGTGVDLSAVQTGDSVYLEKTGESFNSPLNPTSTGQLYHVIAKDATSVTVRDSGNISEETVTLGVEYESVIRFFSGSGVQIGDKVSIDSSSNFNSENTGTFEVIGISDRDVSFFNPDAIPETVTSGVDAPFSFFERTINFVSVEASGPISLGFNGGTETIRLKEYTTGSAVFVSTVEATSVYAINTSDTEIRVSFQSCSF